MSDRYKIAAASYLLYAIIYLTGAIIQLTPERKVELWWLFYVGGAIVMVVFPGLVYKRYKWFTRVLTVFPLAKALVLVWREIIRLGGGDMTLLFNWFFAAVAVWASVALYRASWLSQPES